MNTDKAKQNCEIAHPLCVGSAPRTIPRGAVDDADSTKQLVPRRLFRNADPTKLRFGVGIFPTGLIVASLLGALAAAPATQPSNLPPTNSAPQVSEKSTVVPIPYRPWLPPARMSREPRVARSDNQHALRVRPALDVPPLADLTGDLPGTPVLDAGPGIRVTSADPAALPVATIAAQPNTAKAEFGTDPTLDVGPVEALVKSAPPRSASPPILLLSIPDPTHQSGAVPTTPPATDSGPVTHVDAPEQPVFVVTK